MTAPIHRFSGAAGAPLNREAGVTLVELMIALLLGLVLTAGAIQVFTGNRSTYAFAEGLARVQENGRFALNRIAERARMGGYIGCLSNVGIFNNLAGAANPFRDDLAIGVQGHDFNGTGAGELYAAGATDPMPLANAASWTPALPAELVNRVVPGSDVLVIRNVSGNAAPLVAPFSDLTQLTVAAPVNFQAGDVLVATDCQRASIFQLTGIAAAGGNLTLAHAAGGGFTPGNDADPWSADQAYGLAAEVSRLETTAFYIGRGESDAPSLFQLRLQRTDATTSQLVAEELAEGIDTLQVRYGLDLDNDRQVDAWQTADLVAAADDWERVLSVEVTLLARSLEEYGTETDAAVHGLGDMRFDPVDDRRLRKAFTATVGIRNRLP